MRPLDFLILTKPRLNLLVLLTTLVGMHLAAPDGVPIANLLHTLLGTAFVAGGAAALNQVLERDTDSLMHRTRTRPLPGGRLKTSVSIGFGLLLSFIGLFELLWAVNILAATVAGITLVSYLFLYTPLKQRTWLSTLVGAFPGALPPVIGWSAVTGDITLPAITLFGIVFVWQIPHFFAIAWIHREDYARADIPLLPVLEPDGQSTGRQAYLYAALLLPISLTPALTGLGSSYYVITAVTLGVVLLAFSIRFAKQLSIETARHLFLASITYLPLLWSALVIDHLWLP